MFISSIVLASVAIARQEPRTVTYTNPGARLEVLMPGLSKAAGVKLVASRDIAGVPVVVRFDKAPLDEALIRLASAARGVWTMENGVRILHEDREGIAKMRAEALDLRRSIFHDILAELRRSAPPGDVIDRPPADIAIARALAFVNDTEIADLPDGSRVVYSTRATVGQEQLPAGTDAIFSQMAHDLSKLPVDAQKSEGHLLLGASDHAELTVQAGNSGFIPFVSVSITILDRSGDTLFSKTVLGEDPSWQRRQGPQSYIAVPDHPLSIDPFYLNVLHCWLEQGPTTPAVLSFIKKPLRHDPIEPEGATLVAYATLRNAQLAASLTDQMTRAWFTYGDDTYIDKGPAPTKDGKPEWSWWGASRNWLEQIVDFRTGDKGVTDDHGWMVIHRRISTVMDIGDPGAIMDRHQLQRVADAASRLHGETLQDQIQLARLGAGQLGYRNDWRLPQLLLIPSIENDQNWRLPSSLSLLTDAQVRRLLAGKRIYLAKTPKAFQARYVQETARRMSQGQLQLSDVALALPTNSDPHPTIGTGLTAIAKETLLSLCYIDLSSEERIAAFVDQPPDSYYRGIFSPGWLRNLGKVWGNTLVQRCEQHDYELHYHIGPSATFQEEASAYDAPTGPKLTVSQFLASLAKE